MILFTKRSRKNKSVYKALSSQLKQIAVHPPGLEQASLVGEAIYHLYEFKWSGDAHEMKIYKYYLI
jgi:hypothetical protein